MGVGGALGDKMEQEFYQDDKSNKTPPLFSYHVETPGTRRLEESYEISNKRKENQKSRSLVSLLLGQTGPRPHPRLVSCPVR